MQTDCTVCKMAPCAEVIERCGAVTSLAFSDEQFFRALALVVSAILGSSSEY